MRKYLVVAALAALCSFVPHEIERRIAAKAGWIEGQSERKLDLAQRIIERRVEYLQHKIQPARLGQVANPPQRSALKFPAVYHIAGMEKLKPHREAYKTVENEPLQMDLYRPADLRAGEKRPLVVFANWKRKSMTEWALMVSWGQLVAASGLHAIIYQSAAEPDADLNDLLAHARKNAARLQIDAERIGIVTMSGNTVTALPVITQPERTYIRCGVIYYGMIQEPRVRRDLPLLIVRAGLERSAELQQRLDDYVSKLLAQNAPLTLINYPDGHHSFDLVNDTERSREIIRETLAFLNRQLRLAAAEGGK